MADDWGTPVASSDDWGTPISPAPQSAYLDRQNALIEKMQEDKGRGFLPAVTEDVKGLLPGSLKDYGRQVVNTVVPGSMSSYSLVKSYLQDAQRRKAGYGKTYRALAPLGAAATGINLEGMEKSAASGDPRGVVGHAALPTTLALSPLLHEGVVEPVQSGMRRGAEGIAESALGVGNKGRAFGKTPGVAVLEETNGIRPSTVLDSTRERMSLIGKQLEDAYRQAGAQGKTASLDPAIQTLNSEINAAIKGQNEGLLKSLTEKRQRLQTDLASGGPLGRVSPERLWKIKQNWGDDINWNTNVDPKIRSRINRQIYRAMDDELDSLAPGTEQMNQRYSSLATVRRRADIASRGESIPQAVLNRWARRTGGALGGIYELAQGHPLGALAATVGPEVLAHPTTQMGIARTMYYLGGGKRVPFTPFPSPAIKLDMARLNLGDANNVNRRFQGTEARMADASRQVDPLLRRSDGEITNRHAQPGIPPLAARDLPFEPFEAPQHGDIPNLKDVPLQTGEELKARQAKELYMKSLNQAVENVQRLTAEQKKWVQKETGVNMKYSANIPEARRALIQKRLQLHKEPW